MPFFEKVRVLDPGNIVDCNRTSIVSTAFQEWELYVKEIGPQAVKNLNDGEVIDLKLFWKSKAASLPALYQLASCYCTTTIGFYDVERSFSAYNALLDKKCRSLATDSIKAFHFLNWNLRMKSPLEEERNLQRETGKAEEKPKKRPAPHDIKTVRDNKEMNVETEERQKPNSAIDDHQDSSPAPKKSRLSKNNPTKKVGNNSPGNQFGSSIMAFMSNTASKKADSYFPVNPNVAKEPQPIVNIGLDGSLISKIQRCKTSFSFPGHLAIVKLPNRRYGEIDKQWQNN